MACTRGGLFSRAGCALHCCTHCGFPDHSLCCFGCSYTTRVIFIGSGGVITGISCFIILLLLLICHGSDIFHSAHGNNAILKGFLVLGIIYIPMGLALIYTAQTKNPCILQSWIIINFFFAVVEAVGLIVEPILASSDKENYPCGKTRIALAVFFLQLFIFGCRCYCIAIVTQYRRKLLAAKAAQRAVSPEDRPRTY